MNPTQGNTYKMYDSIPLEENIAINILSNITFNIFCELNDENKASHLDICYTIFCKQNIYILIFTHCKRQNM